MDAFLPLRVLYHFYPALIKKKKKKFEEIEKVQGDLLGNLFWRRGGHQEGCNNGAKGHPRKILPAVQSSVIEKNG